jgi:hypothetical protein
MEGDDTGDVVRCGTGRDTVAYDARVDEADTLVGCERVWVFD